MSSTQIRAHAKAGELEAAAKLLGRPFEVDGVVVGGDRRGGTLGFPTANLRVEPTLLVPAYGIYAGAVGDRRAAVSIGVNPHYGGTERRIEAYLLDWEGDLYGDRLVVELWRRLRDERAFDERGGADRADRPGRRRDARGDAPLSAVPKLVLLNGPPAVGKSTLARRYADEHPLTLVLEIDAVRALLGRGSRSGSAPGHRRAQIALAMARTHLEAGHDVIVPQLLTRRPFVEMLRGDDRGRRRDASTSSRCSTHATSCSRGSSSEASPEERSAPAH